MTKVFKGWKRFPPSNRSKSTIAFREDFVRRCILRYSNWFGTSMNFPYTWNGERRLARITLKNLLKIIEWDIKI